MVFSPLYLSSLITTVEQEKHYDSSPLLCLSNTLHYLDSYKYRSPKFCTYVIFSMGVDTINTILQKFEKHYYDKKKLLDSRIFCYLLYLRQFLSVIITEKYGTPVTSAVANDIDKTPTFLYRVVIDATKEDCQGFFTKVKLLAIQSKAKGYFRISDSNDEYIAYHIMVQLDDVSTRFKFYQGLLELLSNNCNAELSIFDVSKQSIAKGKLFRVFEVFEVLPISKKLQARNSSITSAFDGQDSYTHEFEPNFYFMLDNNVLKSFVSSHDDDRSPRWGGFDKYRIDNILTTISVRMEIEPILEQQYRIKHEKLKTNFLHEKNTNIAAADSKKKKIVCFHMFEREMKQELHLKQEQEKNKGQCLRLDKTDKGSGKTEDGKKEDEKETDDQNTTEIDQENVNETKNDHENEKDVLVMFYSAIDVDAKNMPEPSDTEFSVPLSYFKQQAEYNVSAAAQFGNKNGKGKIYKIGLDLSKWCLQLFFKMFVQQELEVATKIEDWEVCLLLQNLC